MDENGLLSEIFVTRYFGTTSTVGFETYQTAILLYNRFGLTHDSAHEGVHGYTLCA